MCPTDSSTPRSPSAPELVAAAGVAVSLRGARRELDDRTAPLAGLVAAFIFAVQMLNFPVAAGTSGHLLGGALAAILVGPYTGVLCVSVVLLMQGLLFADGGLTALGVNITDMARRHRRRRLRRLPRVCVRLLPRRRAARSPSRLRRRAGLGAGRGAGASPRFYAIGGTTDVPDRQGPHRDGRRARADRHRRGRDHRAHRRRRPRRTARPRHGARGLAPALELRGGGEHCAGSPAAERRTPSAPTSPPPPVASWPSGSLVALVLAGFVSFYASAAPTAWRRSPPTRASTRRPRTTPPRTPRSPTTASRTRRRPPLRRPRRA